MSKWIKKITLLSLCVVSTASTLPYVSTAYALENRPTATMKQEIMTPYESNWGLSQLTLDKIRSGNLSKEEEQQLLKSYTNHATSTRMTGIELAGFIATIAGLVKLSYDGGKYLARQAHVRLGLTPKKYKANRWALRAVVFSRFGPFVAVGFDDYFYGI